MFSLALIFAHLVALAETHKQISPLSNSSYKTNGTLLNVSLVAIGSNATYCDYAALPYSGPGFSLAVDRVQGIYAGTLNFSLHFIGDRTCTYLQDNLIVELAQWHYEERNEHDLTIYLSPEYTGTLEMIYLQAQWNTLLIATENASPKKRKQFLYGQPTWISTNCFHLLEYAELYINILNKYNWTSITVVIDEGSPPFYSELGSMVLALLQVQKRVTYAIRYIDTKIDAGFGEFAPLLKKIRASSRILLYFGGGSALREFLHTTYLLNMTNGEYVYILVEINPFLPSRWQNIDNKDQAVLQSLQSVLILHPSENTQNDLAKMQLGKHFLRRTERDFNYIYPLSTQPYILIASAYTTVFALAEVINDTLVKNKRPDWSGSVLAHLLTNRTFRDDVGNTMYIDSDGQRRTDITVSFFDTNGNRMGLLQKFGNTEELVEITHLLTWANNATFPPPNEPLCGYINQSLLCRTPGDIKSTILSISWPISLAVMGVLTASGYVVSTTKRWLLSDPWWQIHLHQSLEDVPADPSIHPITTRGSRSLCSAVVFGSHKHKPVMGWKVCGRSCAVHFTDISFSKKLVFVLRQIRKIEHINICQFLGLAITNASTDMHWISAVIESPPRGPLPDIFGSCVSRNVALISSLILDYLEVCCYALTTALSSKDKSFGCCRQYNTFILPPCNFMDESAF
ncbi:atrial natriuretic peptide receptor 1-like [Paramacrobiotus metropolitanus]|uniref:atrial natriuretic peptide receptor 1-like n=1 Tax=Paramacrobiotus metropolitanus TaxID=2943436 RepID=UPI0024461965|nr:atrial natriuretic peptide receptor 1-like [Paramacrobiotus metropolitanus]